MFNDLDDDLDGLFSGTAPVRPLANDPLIEAQVAHATRRVYRERCGKCGGSGRYNAPSSLGHNSCLACNGVGYKEFKTAPDVRAKQREAADERRQARATKLAEQVNSWTAQNPDIADWLTRNAAKGFEFAQSLLDAVTRYGALTPGQYAAVERCIERDKVRQAQWDAERNARVAQAPTVSIAAIETSLATAKSNGLKFPKLRLADFVFSLASATSANAGSIYVKDNHGEYLGKISGGKLLAVRACSEEAKRSILEVAADPKQAAIAYGKQYGTCACCGRDLTDPASVALGIGPVCASKWGW
jgi:hypothetical protein